MTAAALAVTDERSEAGRRNCKNCGNCQICRADGIPDPARRSSTGRAPLLVAAPDAHRVIGTRPHLTRRFEAAAVLSCSARDFARLQRYALSCARALRRRCSTSSTGLNRKTARSSPAVSRSAVTCRLVHGAPLHAAMHHQCHRQHSCAPCLKRVSAFGSEERRLAPGAVTPRRYMHRNAI